MTPDTVAILAMGAISNILLAVAVKSLAKVATELSTQNKSLATIATNTARTDLKMDKLSVEVTTALSHPRKVGRGGD